MSSSFTAGTTTVQPTVIDGYEAVRVTRHVFQPILGVGLDAWTAPAGLRSGTLTAVSADRATAQSLADMLAGVLPVTFADSDVPALGMKFLGNGNIGVRLDDDTRSVWVVTVDFQEVT
jgi:hypothetical protein